MNTLTLNSVECLDNPSLFVSTWLVENNITLNKSSTAFIDGRGIQVSSTIIVFEMYKDYLARFVEFKNSQKTQPVQLRKSLNLKLTKNDFIDSLDYLMENNKIKMTEELRDTLKHNGNTKSWELSTKLMDLCFDFKSQEDKEMKQKIFLQHLYNIKRKLVLDDCQCKYTFLMFLYGAGGVGKSYLIDKICSPFVEYHKKASLSLADFNDSLGVKNHLTNNYVIVLDEFRGLSKLDLQALKSYISDSSCSSRSAYEKTATCAKNHASFFSSSNVELDDCIVDNNNRRFIQFNMAKDIQNNWNEIDSFDFIELFRSIDENGMGYMTTDDFKAISDVIKSESYQPNAFEQWCLDMNVTLPELNKGKSVPVSDLWLNFKVYIETNNMTKYSSTWFYKKLKKFAGPSIIKNNIRTVDINIDSLSF